MPVYRLLLIGVALCARAALAKEPVEFATIPYRDICLPERAAAAAGQCESSMVTCNLKSKLKSVAPGDIKLQLCAGEITREISVDEDGDFTLSFDQALWDANAVLVSNQPKGSLQVELSLAINPSSLILDLQELLTDGRIGYADLYRAALAKRVAVIEATWARRLEASATALQSEAVESNSIRKPPRANAEAIAKRDCKYLVLWPSAPGKTAKAHLEKNRASVFSEIFSETYPDDFSDITGRPLLRRDKDGIYGLTCTSELLARNPEVVLSTNQHWNCAIFSLEELRVYAAKKQRRNPSQKTASQ